VQDSWEALCGIVQGMYKACWKQFNVAAWKSIERVASSSRCTETVVEECDPGEGLPLGSELFDSS
jgi:hypothetical protein